MIKSNYYYNKADKTLGMCNCVSLVSLSIEFHVYRILNFIFLERKFCFKKKKKEKNPKDPYWCPSSCIRNEFAGLEARVEKSKWWTSKETAVYDTEELRDVRWLDSAVKVYTKALDTLW